MHFQRCRMPCLLQGAPTSVVATEGSATTSVIAMRGRSAPLVLHTSLALAAAAASGAGAGCHCKGERSSGFA